MHALSHDLAVPFCRGQPLGSHRLLTPTAARRRQPELARADGGGGGGGGGASRPRRENLRFLIPGSAGRRLLQFTQLTQGDFTGVLERIGAVGFQTSDGRLSCRLEEVPKSGDVLVVLPDQPAFATQRAFDNDSRSRKMAFEAFLLKLASTENAGTSIITLQTVPFKGISGEDHVQLDAGVRAANVLYVGEYKRVLGEDSVVDLDGKLSKIRAALASGSSPDLATAVEGVTHAKLFLGGDMVRPGLTVQEMAELAAAKGMSLVLPSGQALGLAAGAAPAVQLC